MFWLFCVYYILCSLFWLLFVAGMMVCLKVFGFCVLLADICYFVD